MNSVQLECFIAVAQTLNFSKAAKKLHISQPAISHQISSLESELNVSLFSRTNKNVELTHSAVQFMNDAIKILDIEREAKKKLKNQTFDQRYPFEICCHNQLELDLIPDALHHLQQEHPHIFPIIRYMNNQIDEKILENDTVFLTLGIKKKITHDQIGFEELGKVFVSCVYSKWSELINNHDSNISLKDIHDCVYLSHELKAPEEIIQMQNQVIKYIDKDSIQYCETFEIITSLVKAGMGVTIRPDIKKSRDPSLHYKPIKEIKAIPFGVYYKKDNNQQVLKDFIQLLKKEF